MRAADAARAAIWLAGSLRSQWREPEWLAERQLRALRAQLAHAASTVPFYRKRWAECGFDPSALARLEDLARLPLVRREDIQRDAESFLSERGDRRQWRSSRTSGSTGKPLVSWFDPDGWAQAKLAIKLRRLLASGWRPGQALVVVEALDREAIADHERLYALPGERWLGARRYLSVFEAPERHLASYRAWRPAWIYAPPSYLAALAAHWHEELRRAVPLRALMTSAEWMHPWLRERLRAAFGVPVLDVYGSTEFKEIAWQCAAGGDYHVNAESVVVEIVGGDGLACPAGEWGEIVVSSLHNRAMPLVRYATGDRGRLLPGRCRCGRGLPLMDRVEGRLVEYLTLPGARSLSPYELTSMIELQPGVLQYRVVQTAPERLDVAVVLGDGAAAALDGVRDAVQRRVGPAVTVEVRRVASIPRDPSGKHRCVHGIGAGGRSR
jgi:phenylacetate-CoA ligase